MIALVNAIARRLAALERGQVILRTASVAAVSGGKAIITLAGSTVSGVPYLASYSPTVGDTVLVLQRPGQLLILGKPA